MENTAPLAVVLTTLAALALVRGFSGQAWSDRVAVVAWLLLPGAIFGHGWTRLPAEFTWVRAFLLVALVWVVWDRALRNQLSLATVRARIAGKLPPEPLTVGLPPKGAARGLERFRRLTGWMFAPLAAMLLVRVIPLAPLESSPRDWLIQLFLEDGRFALVGAWAFALWRVRERPPFILWASAWTALHVASLATLPEARHFLDLSATFLAQGMIYALGAWGLQQLFPKWSGVVWALIIAHDVRLWFI